MTPENQKDQRPDPNPRKNPALWQSYLWWDELMQMRKRHTLRLKSIEAGKSNLNAEFEEGILEHQLSQEWIASAKREMMAAGELAGPIWDWLNDIKGIGPHTAAKLLALFDDPARFATVSKFWRFAGYAVIDGKADRCQKGKKSPFNRRLKGECFVLAENFIKQQTPLYTDIYYEEKDRLRRLYPEPVKTEDSPWPTKYTKSHIHRMARRKMIKIFLQHFYVKWREYEGLPISQPYVQAILGHTNIIEAGTE